MKWSPNSFQNRDDISFVCEVSDPKQSLQLLKTDDNSCTRHEPNQSSMGKKIHKKTQPVQRKEKWKKGDWLWRMRQWDVALINLKMN